MEFTSLIIINNFQAGPLTPHMDIDTDTHRFQLNTISYRSFENPFDNYVVYLMKPPPGSNVTCIYGLLGIGVVGVRTHHTPHQPYHISLEVNRLFCSLNFLMNFQSDLDMNLKLKAKI